MTITKRPLEGMRVSIPENRQLDILSALIENRGGEVMSVPMIAIHDRPNPEPVLEWLRSFISNPPSLFIILTGEGLRRILKLAGKHELEKGFIEALSLVRTLVRGPKPERELRKLGLNSTLQALTPTTQGIITSLEEEEIEGHDVAVQLYGDEPNLLLTGYLEKRRANVLPVSPYIYASEVEENKLIELIDQLSRDELDIVVFTSQPQFKRLDVVSRKLGRFEEMVASLNRSVVAVIGPLVKEQLEAAGINVDIMPERRYFMKPMVSAMCQYVQKR